MPPCTTGRRRASRTTVEARLGPAGDICSAVPR